MTQGFDEFESKEQEDFESFMMRYKKEFRNFEKIGEFTYSDISTSIAYDAYQAGAASRQAEIDELKCELETLQGMHNATSLYAGELVDERDELQKRIINALNTIESSEEISHMLYRKVYKILKGEEQ